MLDLQTGWKMSRCTETPALNHVWRKKCWKEPNPETHEKNRRMGHSSSWSFCVFVTWLVVLHFALWGLHEAVAVTEVSHLWMVWMKEKDRRFI